jgi:hypothetical protein
MLPTSKSPPVLAYEPLDQREQQSLFRRFFSAIKDKLSEGGVERVFITGVSPIALNDFTSGFNITTHITHHEEFEGICSRLN